MVRINHKALLTWIAIAIILLSAPFFPKTQAQTNTPFNPSNIFSVPSQKGTISFAVNGTYSSATLENNTWFFQNLQLNGSRTLANFSVSVENCNITIYAYQAFTTSRVSIRLIYVAQGVGKQVFNFGVGSIDLQLASTDWSVIINNNVFLALGSGWTITQDGTVTVDGLTGLVNVVRWGFVDNNVSNSNVPFYEQHSVAIITVTSVAVIVAVALVVKMVGGRTSVTKEVSRHPKSDSSASALTPQRRIQPW